MTLSDLLLVIENFLSSNSAAIWSIITLFVTIGLANSNQKYLDEQDKNRHLIILRECYSVKSGFAKINAYRNDIYARYYLFLGGITAGLIGLNLVKYLIELVVKLFENINLNTSLVTYFVSIFLTFGCFKLWERRLSPNGSLDVQFNNLKITPASKKVLYFYYLSAGIIIGINCAVGLQIYDSKSNNSFLCSYLYILGISISLIFLYYVKKIISLLYFKGTKRIMNFYRNNFPYVTIKTSSGDVNGKLWDILTKDSIMLKELNTLKAVPWNKIDVIEIKKKE